MNPPHTPYEDVPECYLDLYAAEDDPEFALFPNVPAAGTRGGDYYRRSIRHQLAMITGVDRQFGRILSTLDRLGVAEDTLVVFTSDHGDLLGRHKRHPAGPFNFNKPAPFEEAMQVPFILRFPGRIPAGTDDLLLSTPDIHPTLLGLLGLADRIPPTVDGRNLAAAICRQPQAFRPEGQIYCQYTPGNPAAGIRGWRTSSHTFFVSPTAPASGRFLYDRRSDPFQMDNLAARCPDLREGFEARMRKELHALGDPWADCN